ncbi:hypothetical protein [Hydrogenophaga palleronii]|uniref:hypothetical protein n=1 Tax=Hydrogenophaga palleronii TaxID=65655 RepID=UPI0012ED7236|nr:hypothetical protein [Hydrogenophaga palleronii]
MAALATFDRHGLWLSTSVCEGASCPVAASAGMRWGRWVDGHPAVDTDEAEVGQSRALVALRRHLGLHVAERVQCVPQAEVLEASRPLELRSDGGVACAFLQGTALIYLRTPSGFTGLLCEAGDWVLLPAGMPHVFDAGASPDLSFLRLSEGTRGWFPLHTGKPLPPTLPGMDAFIAQLLHALGEDIEGP